MVAAFDSWWDTYSVRLVGIETERDAAAKGLRARLKELGYGF